MKHFLKLTAISILIATFVSITNSTFANAYTTNGWSKEGDSWYYYVNGNKSTGWVKSNGNSYYLDSNGKMKSNSWYKDNNNHFFYFNDNGIMQKGWTKIEGNWYYFGPLNGALYTNMLIDGKYLVDSFGVYQSTDNLKDSLKGTRIGPQFRQILIDKYGLEPLEPKRYIFTVLKDIGAPDIALYDRARSKVNGVFLEYSLQLGDPNNSESPDFILVADTCDEAHLNKLRDMLCDAFGTKGVKLYGTITGFFKAGYYSEFSPLDYEEVVTLEGREIKISYNKTLGFLQLTVYPQNGTNDMFS